MSIVRRCLGCSATYAFDAPACPECGSCAGEAEEGAVRSSETNKETNKPKPRRKR